MTPPYPKLVSVLHFRNKHIKTAGILATVIDLLELLSIPCYC